MQSARMLCHVQYALTTFDPGVDSEGLLQAIEVVYYANCGRFLSQAEYTKGALARFSDSGEYLFLCQAYLWSSVPPNI